MPIAITAAERLRRKLAPVLAEVAARTQLIVRAERPQEMYARLLRLLHSEVRASVPLLETAARVAVERSGADPVAAAIVDYLREHAEEERHHDEWLLDDYAAIGGDPAELLGQHGSPTVASIVGSVYYWTIHAHPVAILGYCAVLEGSPPPSEFIDTLEARTGYPHAAFTTLRHHSVIDLDHRRELFDFLDALPLTPEHEALVGMTALQTADLLIAAADELLSVPV